MRTIRWGSGDNVVDDELHYEATYVLYKDLERTTGIQLRIARHRDGTVGVSDFEPLVDGRTRVLSVAWVTHQNGFLHDMKPLADLAHAHGAYLYSDAIQAVGMFPIDVRRATGVDFFAAGTQEAVRVIPGRPPHRARPADLFPPQVRVRIGGADRDAPTAGSPRWHAGAATADRVPRAS